MSEVQKIFSKIDATAEGNALLQGGQLEVGHLTAMTALAELKKAHPNEAFMFDFLENYIETNIQEKRELKQKNEALTQANLQLAQQNEMLTQMNEYYANANQTTIINNEFNGSVGTVIGEMGKQTSQNINDMEKDKFTLNFYAPVGQSITNVENLYATFDKDMQMQVQNVERVVGATDAPTPDGAQVKKKLPKELNNDEAKALFEKLCQHGYLDENFQPTESLTKTAIIANLISKRLNLTPKWTALQKFWNINDLSHEFTRAKTYGYFDKYQRELVEKILR